jgi:multiple sugar transport system substrate-binding protein
MRRTVFGIAICVALLGACSSERRPADPRAAGDGPVEASIEVQVSGEPEETAVYQGLVEEFQNQNPNVDVELIEIAEKDDHLARLATAFSGGEPPDIFLVNFREYSQFAVLGAIAPLGPFVEEAGIDLDSYYPQPLEAFTFEGELMCMPQNISSLVVYYNTDLFEQAGLDPPAEGWTWDDFRATAQALTGDGNYGLGIEPSIIRVAPFVWGNGGEIVDDPDNPTRFTLDTPEAREALEYIVALVRDDRVVPTESEVASKDLETRFGQGSLGMLLSSRRDTPQFREINSLHWDVAPLPVGREPAGILHSDAYCISEASDAKEAAFGFIEYATGETGQEITASAGRTVPSLKEVSTSTAFLDPTQPPEHSQVFLDGIPFIQRTPVISTWTEIEDAAEEILTRAFYEDGYTIDDAIQELEAATQPLFEEAAGP